MSQFAIHPDDVAWAKFAHAHHGELEWKELVSSALCGSSEFMFGIARLAPGKKIPLHRHKQPETGYVLSGSAMLRLGAQTVEIGPQSAYYFPGNVAHSITAIGNEPFVYLCTYATEKWGQDLTPVLVNDAEASAYNVINKYEARWALKEEIEPYHSMEPTKGYDIAVRYLFDADRGNCKDIMVGIGRASPNSHYTKHRHKQPEIYYGLEGEGKVYLGEGAVNMKPGTAIYMGGNVVHGIDNNGHEPMRVYYIYGVEEAGVEDDWTPVEAVYSHVK